MDYYNTSYSFGSGFMTLLYFSILILSALFSFGAMAYLNWIYACNSKVMIRSGMTGQETAERILHWAGIRDVVIECGDSYLGDHYDPLNKKLVLSPDNYAGTSAANVGVAAHECGHAVQHQQAYAPLQLRMASVYITNWANQILMWGFILFGLVAHIVNYHTAFGIFAACWGVIMVFNLITLPVEFDASARAKKILLQLNVIQPGAESAAVNSTLNAAGLTYVAAFITSLMWFLYYLLNSSRRD